MNQRKIKFRVWCNNSFSYDALIGNNVISFNEGMQWWSINEETIIQLFTGLIDKNGKEIYEGDLINFTVDGVTHGPDAEYEKNVEVWYSEEDAQFVFGHFKANDGGEYWYSKADRVSDIEVVGNIFENKYAKSN